MANKKHPLPTAAQTALLQLPKDSQTQGDTTDRHSQVTFPIMYNKSVCWSLVPLLERVGLHGC